MNIHDRFFKETFGDLAVAKDFLNNYLPKTIQQYMKLETLLPQKDHFIDERLRESFSDLVFQVEIAGNQGYLCFLFEHKSTPDKETPFQLLKYIVRIWEEKIREEKKLPIVIPIVIYQGVQKWRVPKYFAEMIEGFPNFPADLMNLIPNFTYQFYDFSYRSDEEIKGEAILTIYQLLLREISNPNNENIVGSIVHAFSYFSKIESKRRALEYFETVLPYIFSINNNLTKEEGEEMMKKVEENYPEGKNVARSLADLWKMEGVARGRKEGREEGKEEGMRTVIFQLLMKKFASLPAQVEKEIENADLDRLETIIENMFDYETIEDVKIDIKK